MRNNGFEVEAERGRVVETETEREWGKRLIERENKIIF